MAADQELGPAGHSQPDTHESGRLPGIHHGVRLGTRLRYCGLLHRDVHYRGEGGGGTGNLEDFALMVNGTRITAADRNIWGVTFAPGDSDTFYATAASSGRIWLVKGSISARTLTAIHDGVECPSLSPDGTRIAYKKNTGGTLTPHWRVAFLDWPPGRKPYCPSRAAWTTRSNGWTTRPCSTDSPATAPPVTAISGRSTRIRRPGLPLHRARLVPVSGALTAPTRRLPITAVFKPQKGSYGATDAEVQGTTAGSRSAPGETATPWARAHGRRAPRPA